MPEPLRAPVPSPLAPTPVQEKAATILRAQLEAKRLLEGAEHDWSFSRLELREFGELMAQVAAIAEQYHLALYGRSRRGPMVTP